MYQGASVFTIGLCAVAEMNLSVAIFLLSLSMTYSKECSLTCPESNDPMICGLDVKTRTYKLFPSGCALAAYTDCHKVEYVQTPIMYCIVNTVSSRRMYGESCPLFCPNHYRPVCGANKQKMYIYRTFTNGCYMDMLNCRGDEESPSYVEVPLEFCPNHAMKNIWKEKVVSSNLHDYEHY